MDNSTKELELLGLTETDFDLIITGLDNLPSSGGMGDMIGDMMMSTIFKDHDDVPGDIKAKLEEAKREREEKKRKLEEDTKILQGKLILFRRYMVKNKLFSKE